MRPLKWTLTIGSQVKKIKSRLRFATRLMARAQEHEEGKGASACILQSAFGDENRPTYLGCSLTWPGSPQFAIPDMTQDTFNPSCASSSHVRHISTSLTFTLRLSAHHPLSYCEGVHETRVTVPLQYTCQSTHQTCHASVSSSLTPLTRSSRPVYPSTSNTPKKQSSMVCPPSRPRASARRSSRPLRRLLRSIRNGEGRR